MTLKLQLEQYAKEIGIDLFGVTSPEPYDRFLKQLDERKEHYLARYAYRLETWKKMATPMQVLPDAKSVIVIGFYYLPEDEAVSNKHGKVGKIVTYGHLGILKKVRLLQKFLIKKGYTAIPGSHRKEAAIRAGLGQIGKNNLVINQQFGSWVAYQTLVTNAELEFDKPQNIDPCQDCEKCLQSCPTKALYQPYKLNPEKCITCLLTSDSIPEEYWDKLGGYILGCDLCQEVCPHNMDLKPKDGLESIFPEWMNNSPSLKQMIELDESSFQSKLMTYIFSKFISSKIMAYLIRFPRIKKLLTAIKGLKNEKNQETLPETFLMASGKLSAYQRNSILAAGISNDKEMIPVLEKISAHPEMKRYAQWSLKKLNT